MMTAVVGIRVSIQLYHNPRCTKSRLTLTLLQDKGVNFSVIEYLKTPPSAKELATILDKLKMQPIDLMRHGEAVFKSEVQGKTLSRDEQIAIMVANPILIERPIVVCGKQAAIGRPPAQVLAVLPS